ncbi:hypothetical protein [Butyrivibrio sp. FCS014]|uniref:hypothetical protein n=1 Tax=Butyrivibrio sp. FCS014 TaxID=1408304 RepID=UPI000463B1E3|nr:hypothetical protein [Butyrivibrio sp. FCS014]
MTRRTRRGKVAAGIMAAILSVTMGLSTMSFNLSGAVAFAETGAETSETEVEAVSQEDTEPDDDAGSGKTDAATGGLSSEDDEEGADEKKGCFF